MKIALRLCVAVAALCVVGMYTSAGNYSLRDNFPPEDSGIAKKLKASGVIS